MKILLINTNLKQLKSFGKRLNHAGMNVLVANDFNQGANIALQKEPEMIVFFIQDNDERSYEDALAGLSASKSSILINNLSQNTIHIPDKDHASSFRIFQPQLLPEDQLLNLCLEHRSTLNLKACEEKKILLVEDSLLSRLYFSAILAKLNVAFEICDGLEQALNAFDKTEFDLVISDFKFKDGDGIQLLRKIQAVNKKIPVIIISGHTESEVLQRSGHFECFAFLTKPVDEKTLMDYISTALSLEKISVTENQNANDTPYNPERLFSLLKHDNTKIQISVREYLGFVDQAIKNIPSVIRTRNTDDIRPVFHDLLNLSAYYGADHLIDLIMQFRAESENMKVTLLLEIELELRKILNYYQKFFQD